jgi:adenylate cyclase
MPAPTTPIGMERKLAAILSADVKGYSRLMGDDEVGTLRTLTAYRKLIDARIAQHRGRIVGTAGDSVLAEFASVVDAVQCAVEMQTTLKAENANLPPDRRMEFRIGINLGDVMVEGEQIYGDGVNIAARMESLADPGGICISGTVHEHIRNKLSLRYEDLGEQTVKNIAQPVRVFRVLLEVSSPLVGEGQGEGVSKEAGSPESDVRSPTSKIQSPKLRRVGIAHLAWVVVAGLVLIMGGIVIVRYLFHPSLSPQSSSLVTQEAQPPLLPLPNKPSIVVLPFVNMSKDPEQEYFSDGLTEVLTGDLSKISSLFVIARNSAFTYKGKAAKVQDVGREMGVRYVLEGSVLKADNQVRITAQLIDATTGYHLWSERYDRPLQDIFALQDEIVQKIVTTLKLQLTLQEQGFIVRKHTDNLEAYDAFLRGQEYYWRLTKEAIAQARQLWEKAIALDPQYAEAYAGLGDTYRLEWAWRWSADSQALEHALVLAQQAVALDDSLPAAHSLLGEVYALQQQYDQALAEGERAIALDSNNDESYTFQAQALNFAGRPEEALRAEEARAPLQRYLSRYPNILHIHLMLAVVYSELGQAAEARAEAAEVLRLNPRFSLEVHKQRMPIKDPSVLERQLAALRKAGLK